MSTPKLLHILYETDLRCSHTGLKMRLQEEGVSMKDLGSGDIVAFLNATRDKIKILAFTDEKDSEGIVAYYKSPHGRVPLEAIQFIPECFGGSGFSMNAAIKKALIQKLSKKRKVVSDV